MNKDIVDKIRVIKTDKNERTFEFPEDGWFVSATNSNFGPDEFGCVHLYKPSWSSHSDCTFGGETMYKDGSVGYYWTYNYVYSNIEKKYLYYCQDEDTAKELQMYLAMRPSKSLTFIDEDIDVIKKQISMLEDTLKELEDSRPIVEALIKKAE